MTSTIISKLITQLRLEEKAQEERFLSENISLKELKDKGIIIYPVKIQRKSFEHNYRPLIHFSFSSFIDTPSFQAGTPVTVFHLESNEVCNGQLFSISDKEAEVLLFSDDFPDWIDEKNIGIKRLPDSRSFKQMHGVLRRIEKEENQNFLKIFEIVHGKRKQNENIEFEKEITNDYKLNPFQVKAVKKGLADIPVQIIHGPPGTGKTTTVTALIKELIKNGKSVIATAPGNAAVDYLSQKLIEKGLKILRLGNTAKVNQSVWEYTPDGILSQDKYRKTIKKLKIQAEEYRKMSLQYKRNFGKSEREQRKLLRNEIKTIKTEIKALNNHYLTQYLENADVVLGTPIGLIDELISNKIFDVAVIDEAGQCIEPLAWLVVEKAKRVVLSGDYLQLPPTIISEEAKMSGLAISILEQAVNSKINSRLLQIQYRMPPEIAEFSSRYFYDGKLQSAPSSNLEALVFYDTAGAGFDEKREVNGNSISNPEELRIVAENIEKWTKEHQNSVFISPYNGQVELAKKQLKGSKVSTIDAFQGQEADLIILSLVRSNPEGKIGFLSDYRRMNVALTRAKKKLIVIGDSTTLSGDEFYKSFIDYTEEINAYRSVFELLY